MPNEAELARRTQLAFEAIQRSLDTEAGEEGATLFASHHLEELDRAYWQTHLGSASATSAQVLGLLQLQSHWGGDDELSTLDFALPGDVSQYVLSVRFDEAGEVADISMES